MTGAGLRRDWVAARMAGDLQRRTKREREPARRAATEYLGARRRLKLLLAGHEWERRLGHGEQRRRNNGGGAMTSLWIR